MTNKATLLYVDDEQMNLMLFEFNFRKKFNIITADSGVKGLELLNLNPQISVVISDMKMPFMNGIEFIKKAKIEYPHINFYILTGFDITEEIADALNEKLIIKYFRKPFDLQEIEGAIFEVIG